MPRPTSKKEGVVSRIIAWEASSTSEDTKTM
jgi:hypothetical protein